MNRFLLNYEECLQASQGHALTAIPHGYPAGISLDTRTLKPGELFLAVIGPHFDGHQFIPQALQAGASGVIVSRPVKTPGGTLVIQVADTSTALLSLAHACRMSWGGRVICVTGSAGKTTTKELTADLLSYGYRVHCSPGNFNNEFGVSQTLLALTRDHQKAVVELGMNHPGEIARLAAIAKPDTGILTCIAPVHLGFFPSLEAIADAKAELLPQISTTGHLVYNLDDSLLVARASQFSGRKISFGFSEGADLRAVQVRDNGLEGIEFQMQYAGRSATISMTLSGRHNILNRLAATAACLAEGMSFEQLLQDRKGFRVGKHRGVVLRFQHGFTIIDDSYNSNPRALQCMLDVMNNTSDAHRRIVVAGEMLELGSASSEWHYNCGKMLASHGVDFLIGVQGDARFLLSGAGDAGLESARMAYAESVAAAEQILKAQIRSGDLVLVKGSRGVGLDGLVERMLDFFALEEIKMVATEEAAPC